MNKVIVGDKELTPSEKQELYYCISCRLGIIETGQPMIRASDAKRTGRQVNALTREQRDLINVLEDIMYKLI